MLFTRKKNGKYIEIIIFLLIIPFFVFSACVDESPVVYSLPELQESGGESGTIQPQVQGFYPINGRSDIPVDADVFIVFTKSIDTSTLAGNVAVSGVTGFDLYPTSQDKVVRIDITSPAVLSYDTTYTVTALTGITSADGYQLDQEYTSTFTTAGDPSTADAAPTLIAAARSPASGATDVAVTLSAVQVTFSEAVSNVDTTTFKMISHPGAMNNVTTADNITFSLNLNIPLDYAETYTVDLTSGIVDSTGNALNEDGNDRWSFITQDDPALPVFTGAVVTTVWITNITTNSARINFATSYPLATDTCDVDYDTDTSYSSNEPGSGSVLKTSHSVDIISLTQGTRYYFRVNIPLVSQTVFPGTSELLSFVTDIDGSSNISLSSSAGDKSGLTVLQNTDASGSYDGSSYVLWKNGSDIYAHYFETNGALSGTWTVNGDQIDNGNNYSNIRAFSDGHGYAIVTMEDGTDIFSKIAYNNSGVRAFVSDWGDENATGLNAGTGTNPGVAIIWGYQDNNNVDGGFITNRTSGSALKLVANYFYDFDTDFSSLTIVNGDILVDGSDNQTTVANEPSLYRHALDQTASVISGGEQYYIGEAGVNDNVTAANHSLYNIGNPDTLFQDYNNPTLASPANTLYTPHSYNPNKGTWQVDAGDILYDDSSLYRIVTAVAEINEDVTEYDGNNIDSTPPIDTLVDSSKDFSSMIPATDYIVENTTVGDSFADVVSVVSSTELELSAAIFTTSGFGQNYAIYKKVDEGTSTNFLGQGDQVREGSQNFIATVTIGDLVRQTDDNNYTNVQSFGTVPNERLNLDASIMNTSLIGTANPYKIYKESAPSFTGTNEIAQRIQDDDKDYITEGTLQVGDIIENVDNFPSFARIISFPASNQIDLDDGIFSATENYRVHTGRYCATHFAANYFETFCQITVDSNIAANVATFTVYNGIVSGLADAPPNPPSLLDDSPSVLYTAAGVSDNDLVVNTTDYDNGAGPSIARVDDASFAIRDRALELSLDIMNDGDTYQLLNFNPDVADGDIIETGDVNNVASQNILVDGAGEADFTAAAVKKGDLVYNISDQMYAVVISVDSATQLTLNKNTFDTVGDEYIVFSSEDRLTEAGTVTLDGAGNEFTDLNADFSNVEVGDIAHNNTSNNDAYVTMVNSSSQLTLSSNIMSLNDRYVVLQPRVLFAWSNAGNIEGSLHRLRDGSVYQGAFVICSHADNMRNVQVESASSGRAYVLYEDFTSSIIYGKCINGIGGLAYGGPADSAGISIGADTLLDTASDSSGNLYALYESGGNIYTTRRNGDLTENQTVSIAGSDAVFILDTSGRPTIAYADGSGNVRAIKYSADLLTIIYAVDINSLGTYTFNDDDNESNISISGDNSDGAIVSWIDERYYPAIGFVVMAQAVDGSGGRRWDADIAGGTDYNGDLIAIPSTYDEQDLSLKSLFYNDGGVPYGGIFVWLDRRNGRADIYYDTKSNNL